MTSTQTTVTDKKFQKTLFREYNKLKSQTKASTNYTIEKSGKRTANDLRSVSISNLSKDVIASLNSKTFKRQQFNEYLTDTVSKVKNKVFWFLEPNPGSTPGGFIRNGSHYHFLRIEEKQTHTTFRFFILYSDLQYFKKKILLASAIILSNALPTRVTAFMQILPASEDACIQA